MNDQERPLGRFNRLFGQRLKTLFRSQRLEVLCSDESQEFVETLYLQANADVRAAVDAGHFRTGREHYELHGRSEGRALKPHAQSLSREEKVFFSLKTTGLGLEIGPSHSPVAPKKRGYNVQILDVANASELRAKYQPHDVNLENIEEVDFVWRGEPLHELIGQTDYYDWIIASHVIEHSPDLVSFLRECECLLKPDGVLSLVIPDKRYCFDALSPSSTTGQLLDAWAAKRARPSAGQVFDYVANASKRNRAIAWSADDQGGPDALIHSTDDAKALWERARSTNAYLDIHCWRFTPASFRLILSDLKMLGLLGLGIASEFGTSGCEFYVSLGRQAMTPHRARLESLRAWKAEDA